MRKKLILSIWIAESNWFNDGTRMHPIWNHRGDNMRRLQGGCNEDLGFGGS
jgi:hypothetical protein